MIYEPKRSAIVVVPDAAYQEITRRLDAEIAKHPDAAADREYLYSCLVGFLDEYGYIPEFSLAKSEEAACPKS